MLVVLLLLPLSSSMYDGELQWRWWRRWRRWKTIIGESGRQRERQRSHDGM
jgi:hypothetical protein